MDIHLAGSRPSRRAPKENFTGTVWQDPIITPQAPARLVANRVAFEPGARTAWHTHPLGQTLYVISGVGRVQTKGGPVRQIRPGDVVWIPSPDPELTGVLACPLLRHGRCTVYAQRPLVCRLWGVTESMECPHGCRPVRYLKYAQGQLLLRMIE